ncbi:RNA polymeras-like protein II mediator complex subunit 10 [Melanomma pulvis-pyrius CBS 109.77]|uniref:Mediator of RNA polymerase II transcription subunit 10 n=1 Tax=Melanomma pulvis-pyrius CBS 109.77 TaxID=1314802 RepID=A0A6A6X524_9PLEO|nr:RNA polymeras-like protein II mediator complex subunit 10 [Melanomma pulvis-pyrius CBS 109.77]
MAPGNATATPLNAVEAQLKDVVQNLYNLIVQSFDHQGNPTQDAMKREITSLVQNLVKLSQTAPSVHIDIPPEVTMYVEGSRNPDIFTREFVETVQRMNQLLKGRTNAYLLMRDTLAKDIISAIPELRADMQEVVESTGGTIPI